MPYDLKKVIAIALGQVGYKEKKSAANLEDMTANAGSANYTKFARDIDAIPGFYNGKKQRVAWCDVFVDWCFVKAYGAETGRLLLCQPKNSCGAGCRYSRNYFKAKKRLFDAPQPGDQIFFWPALRINPLTVQHTGLVYKVDATFVYTVEGNAGNAVRTRKYRLSRITIAGYGRPLWDMASTGEVVATPPASTATPTLRKGDQGDDVRRMQEALLAVGYTLPKYGADGAFGAETLAALKDFQKANGLKADGICGLLTWAALTNVKG